MPTDAEIMPQEANKQPNELATPHKKRWTFWRVIGWLVLALLLLVAIAAAYAWQNRYTILEDGFKKILAEQGVEAELSIDKISKNGAQISGIDITEQGRPVFSADGLTVEYEWREALKGRMQRIEVTGTKLRISVDETGKILDGWVPASNDNSELSLPPKGLHIRDSHVEVTTPYGVVKAKGDVTLLSMEDIFAEFTLEPAAYKYGELEVKGGGTIKALIRPDENAVTANLDFTDMIHPLATLSYASLNADVSFELRDGLNHISGPVSLSFAQLGSESLSAENGRLDWTGGFAVEPDKAAIRAADGHWKSALTKVTMTDKPRRKALARALTLNQAMSAAPVTMHFAGDLTRGVEGLLLGANIAGSGEFLRVDERVEVILDGPLTIDGRESRAVIKPSPDAPFYAYSRASKAIALAADVDLALGDTPLSLGNMVVKARSPNGITVEDVSQFSALVTIPQAWKARSDQGPVNQRSVNQRSVKIGPLSAPMDYINQGGTRRMTMALPIDYDGPLPGGYVRGFKAKGALSLDMAGNGAGGGLSTTFTPDAGTQMSVAEFISPTGWRAQNTRFSLMSGAPFYEHSSTNSGDLFARLKGLSTELTEVATGREMSVNVDALELSAALTGAQQSWILTAQGSEITTDDFFGEGTIIGAQDAVLLAQLQPDQAPYIDLRTEAARVKTDQLSTDNMQIALLGTPTDFHLDFGGDSNQSAGRVVFVNDSLPMLPLHGALEFKDGGFKGRAHTVLPKAEDVQIDVDFALRDGTGTAHVDIPQLTFTPKALQPQTLIPALQGKIAEVSGTVSAQIDLAFAPNKPMQSSGHVVIKNVNFGTLPGPFTGVNTEINLTSVFPLQTSGVQTLTMARFNPGIALENGTITYELIPDGVRIAKAVWPMGKGEIALEPTVWSFTDVKNRVVLAIENVELGDLLGDIGGENLNVTGNVAGRFPGCN